MKDKLFDTIHDNVRDKLFDTYLITYIEKYIFENIKNIKYKTILKYKDTKNNYNS